LAPYGHNIRISANTWDPELNAPTPVSVNVDQTFIGDYFGNTTGSKPSGSGLVDYTTSVSTYNDGTNPDFLQQQIVATIVVP
jgi:hypothetical protein